MASAIRGSRVGAGPMGEAERGEAIARSHVSYWCSNGHEVRPSFAEEESVVIPAEWDCPKCGFPAGRDKANQIKKNINSFIWKHYTLWPSRFSLGSSLSTSTSLPDAWIMAWADSSSRSKCLLASFSLNSAMIWSSEPEKRGEHRIKNSFDVIT